MFKISLMMAMQGEAAEIVSRLSLKKFDPDQRFEALQFQFFRAVFREAFELTLTIPGLDPRFQKDSIGTEPAAVSTFATVMELKPDLLINAGTCGSFKREGAEIGKVYLSDEAFFFHDHRIPLPGWSEFGIGRYPSFNVRALAKNLGLETANISSGNSLDYTARDLEIMAANGAILKEMEAGAIAWVAYVTQTPLFAMKSVTNLIDTHPNSPAEFEKNFATAVSHLNQKLFRLFEELASRDLRQALADGKL